jgi:hypothetical protein
MKRRLSADEQRNIRVEIEDATRILERVLTRLSPLDPEDDRVERAQCAIAALKRLSWSMGTGMGRLPMPVKIEAVLDTAPISGAARIPA